MEEQAAHELYTEFAAVDAGARFKQGIGFAGRGAPKALQGWADKDDDDVIARNRRLFGGDRGRQDDRASPDYDSDTAEAVQRRLCALKKEQRQKQAEGPAPLPERLYNEGREERQLRHSQPERALETGRRRHNSRERQRRRSRSRERRRSRSRSRSRRRSRSTERQHRHHSDSRYHSNSRYRRHSRSRERERERRHHGKDCRRSRSRSRSRGQDRRRGEDRVRDNRHAGGSGSGAAAVDGGGSGLKKLDFEALIPGYSAMTAPQKLKAKTQYLLERSEAKDRKHQERGREDGGEQQQWTRYKFSDAAELEEHRLQPAAVYGEGNEDADDVAAAGLGGLSAVTFKQSNAAAVQQERDDSHAAAIFGGGGSGVRGEAGIKGSTAAAGSTRPKEPRASADWPRQQAAAEERRSWLGKGAAGAASSEEDLLALVEAEGAVVVPAAEVAAVLHQLQPAAPAGGTGASGGALSWRERALAAKRAKQQQ